MEDWEVWAEYEKWNREYYGYPSGDAEEKPDDVMHDAPSSSHVKSNKGDKSNKGGKDKKPKNVAKSSRKNVKKAATKDSKKESKVSKSAAKRKSKPAPVEMAEESEKAFYGKCVSRAAKFVNNIDYEGLDMADLKKALKAAAPPMTTTSLMNYYNRPAVTIRKKSDEGTWTDVGYISLSRSLQGTPHPLMLTMTVGIALQLVSCQNYTYAHAYDLVSFVAT